jgi:hypothetical protein
MNERRKLLQWCSDGGDNTKIPFRSFLSKAACRHWDWCGSIGLRVVTAYPGLSWFSSASAIAKALGGGNEVVIKYLLEWTIPNMEAV